MAKRQTPPVLKPDARKAETAMEKTTRIVRKIADEETAQRQAKNDRLRKARLERDASTRPQTGR